MGGPYYFFLRRAYFWIDTESVSKLFSQIVPNGFPIDTKQFHGKS